MSSSFDSMAAGPVSPGTVLAGKYRVERVLGRGGMGIVVEARHLVLDERKALKFLLTEYVQNAEACERFVREAKAAVKIKSEHIARVSDVGMLETGAPYMVMEFLDGSDLARLIHNRGVLPIPEAIDFIIQGCEAIAEAHAYGIVHRDLKPANLFLTTRPDGMPLVKVLDFGISKMMGPDAAHLTRTAASMGSALYMSPEQMQQTRSVDQRTDIYALGISLFELIGGSQPFLAETMPQLVARVLTGTPTPLRELRPEVPEHLAQVIARAYERDQTTRYQTIAELVAALAPYAPARSQAVVDQISRMAGMDPPVVGRASSPPEMPGFQRASPVPETPIPTAAQGQPNTTGWAAGPRLDGPTQELPVTSDTPAPANRPGAAAPVNFESSGQILVPGYAGPVSLRASAAFARGARPRPKPRSSSSVLIIAFIIVGVLAILGVAAVVALRGPGSVQHSPEAQPAQGSPTSAEVAPPIITASEKTAAPEVKTATPVVEPVHPAITSTAATSAAPPSVDTTKRSTKQPGSKTTSAPTSVPSNPTNAPPPVLTAR